MDDREDRIRDAAHRIWEEEGRPDGREAAHWEMASELVAIEENQRLATRPNPLGEDHDGRGGGGEPVEPLVAVENQGEFPTTTDQGEEETTPRRRIPKTAPPAPSPAPPAKTPVAKAPSAKTGRTAKPESNPARKRKSKEE